MKQQLNDKLESLYAIILNKEEEGIYNLYPGMTWQQGVKDALDFLNGDCTLEDLTKDMD